MKRNAWAKIQEEIKSLKKDNAKLRRKSLVAQDYREMSTALSVQFIYNKLMLCESREEVTACLEAQFGRVWHPWMKNVRDDICEEKNLPFVKK